ncbi:RHS repeat-associated core domain-containing protein [Pseudomonas sp. WHRI 8519]|uniref:RHS repeat domain-containing protein n=1 Tax=Pseudomonas sp. WHRI 8519 TaxID=3162567 RepID=UPI0032EDD017
MSKRTEDCTTDYRYDAAENPLSITFADNKGEKQQLDYTYDGFLRRITQSRTGGCYSTGKGFGFCRRYRAGWSACIFMPHRTAMNRWHGSMGREVVQYFHTNLAGLPEQLTDAEGKAIWCTDYEGWGKTRDEWHSPRQARKQNLRYQGQYIDREISLNYNTFRFYDFTTGHFIQSDPIKLEGGLNYMRMDRTLLHGSTL